MKRMAILVFALLAIAVFSQAQTGKIVFTSDRDGNANVYTINADGTGETQLTKDKGSDDQPNLSPDGTTVAYISDSKGGTDVWTIGVDGSGKKQITKTDDYEYDPCYGPDGKSIYYTLDANAGKKIMKTDIASGTTEEIADGFMPSVSSSGKVVYVVEENGDKDVYIGGKNLSKSKKTDFMPSFTADGSKIVFSSARKNDYDIYTMGLDGSNPTVIISSENDEVRASVSPDGNFIVVDVEEGGDCDIVVYDISGNFVSKLTDNTDGDYEPHWGK